MQILKKLAHKILIIRIVRILIKFCFIKDLNYKPI